MATIHDIADYITVRLSEAGAGLNLLKLQKLAYYVQAWHLAFHRKALFPGRFQAWIHGPVNRELYDRFAGTKSLYSRVGPADVRPEFRMDSLTADEQRFIASVLDVYGHLTGDQLEELTHNEEPWQRAREGYIPSQRCEVPIDETVMANFYAARGNSQQ